ncbi:MULTISPECIES: hypothetical protein [Gemmobacter]|jgi:hypothetical protein|uniref:Uncharacterized protein n=2 Tax=Gemmobacter TaxID=204456 RepID=A0A2T6APP9_9RHOB|nr:MULTISPECIES: hypothetical protein [Gemmobacter]OJY36291.1 MAG: hypothetical protein BGP11_08030 [Rhodobacterales bacterium 65-51]PTX45804.1 hypothetical protein C8N34_12044 [Gemmobacter caeni]TWI94109.1 hypothetical protein IQ03_04298 [Gemmobacter caeni]GHC25934.1 hypothetical protein GCM10007291_27120 [Gemmobacter nanjingensis]
MAEQDLGDFYARVARVEKARAKGYGFEADGTLGRSHYQRPRSRRRRVLGPLLIVGLCVLGLKGAMHHQIGDASFQDRVVAMQASQGFERLGGFLMQADPVTLWISAQLDKYL